jgi:plastocyanin
MTAPASLTSRRLVVVVVAVAALALAGCGSSKSKTPAASPTTTGDTTATTTGGFDCTFGTPGQILSAEQAVVKFSPSGVCPGYVTIAPGTAVTWQNQDTVSHTVTVTEGNLPGGKVVATGTAAPGGSWVQPFATEGFYLYVTDALPSFRGVVEVTTTSTS